MKEKMCPLLECECIKAECAWWIKAKPEKILDGECAIAKIGKTKEATA